MNTPKTPAALTVVFRNESPLCIYEPCSYRRVTIDLTPEQTQKLAARFLGISMGQPTYESPSNCFLEWPE